MRILVVSFFCCASAHHLIQICKAVPSRYALFPLMTQCSHHAHEDIAGCTHGLAESGTHGALEECPHEAGQCLQHAVVLQGAHAKARVHDHRNRLRC